MNLAIRGIEAHLGQSYGDSFHADQHQDLKADYILANPPFNVSDWQGDLLRDDPPLAVWPAAAGECQLRLDSALPLPPGAQRHAGFVMANGSLSSGQSGEGEIRKNLIEAEGGSGLVDCIVALPGQLFYTTQIPVCLWIVTRNKGEAEET